jgi:hypothetical protein
MMDGCRNGEDRILSAESFDFANDFAATDHFINQRELARGV